MNGEDFKITAYARIISLSFFLLFYHYNSLSQEKITGVILDNKNTPIQGATISIKNTNRGTLSNAQDNFSIAAKNGDVLMISSVGMEEFQMQLSGQSFITITLLYKISALDEVIVMGYGTVKRKDVTGSVSQVTTANFNKGILPTRCCNSREKLRGISFITVE